jgi:DNA-binding LytR/AlgR family response regulator
MQTKVLVVEDEIYSGKMLTNMIGQIRPDWQVCSVLQSVADTVSFLQSKPNINLIFMDIELADGNCFSIFEQIKVDTPIIFTTAYNEYAIKAFKFNSIDYLLKPIKQTDLAQAIEKYENVLQMIRDAGDSNALPAIDYDHIAHLISTAQNGYRKRFLISRRESFFKLDTKDIACFIFDARITYAVTFDNQRYIINHSMDKLESELDPEVFFRANRQTIINMEAIDKFESYFNGQLAIKLKNNIEDKILVSRIKATQFKEWINR